LTDSFGDAYPFLNLFGVYQAHEQPSYRNKFDTILQHEQLFDPHFGSFPGYPSTANLGSSWGYRWCRMGDSLVVEFALRGLATHWNAAKDCYLLKEMKQSIKN
jgi:hypothetical protein